MKTIFLFFPLWPALTALTFAQSSAEPQPPPPVHQVPAPIDPTLGQRADHNQRVYGPSSDTLVTREAANGVIEGFRKVYKTDNAPRVVIYVNRELVDLESGLKLTGHTEKYEKTKSDVKSDMEAPPAPAGTPQTQINVAVGGNNNAAGTAAGKGTASSSSSKTSGENTYQVKEPVKATLVDKQTVRDVERLFGRAFRQGGAQLADQKSAAALLEEKGGGRLVGDAAAKDRAALANVADIAIEVLISSRNLTVPEIAGDKTYSVPDIQATAIRLKDSAIIGQASASDVLGKEQQAGRIVRQFDVRDITEATALALMEDMLTGAK